jgi:aminoglycoside phosphotransferase (APT) family kinase protein
MERKQGTAAVGPLQRDPWYVQHRPLLAVQLAELLAGIHAVDVPEAVLGRRPGPAAVAGLALQQWAAEVRATPEADTPVVQQAVDWLAGNPPPPPERVTLVHGDYRIGNILHGHDDPDGREPDGLRTVLDWEMAHFGDPIEDVAWAQLVCWQVGTGRVGGLVDVRSWPELYATAAGRAVDPVALRWWGVLGSVKIACLIRRAMTVVAASAEEGLLDRLFADVGDELQHRLLPAAIASAGTA